MSRLWILPALGLIAVLGFACGDSGDGPPPSAAATLTATASAPSESLTDKASPTSASSTSSPEPIADWVTYTDAAAGFSMPIPEGSSPKEQTIELPEKHGYAAAQQRLIGFANKDGLGLVGVSVTPNPGDLTLEDWIRTYPGWPTEPTSATVDGEPGLRFSRSVLDEPADFVFIKHDGLIFELSGNVFGGEGYAATITKADFDVVIDGFRFAGTA